MTKQNLTFIWRLNTMPRVIFLISIIFLIANYSTVAQYGKISGTVFDQQTKEPLIGASVQIVGTTLGAATNLEGQYVILNIPPGLYDVKVTYVGYQEVLVNNVRVTSGLTQDLNFELTPSAIEVKPIVIIAERPLIEKSATNAIRISKSEDFEKLPVRGTEAVFTLQPGVVLQNDRVHIRGSRPSEVGFQLEGANVRNIVGGRTTPSDEAGGSIITTIPEAVEEVLVQAGGYNAEFGGANAGIIQQNLKTGRDKYSWMVQAETDNFADPGEKFLGTYSYGYSDYVISGSGPTISEKIKFYIAGENRFIRDYTPSFWYGANFGRLKDGGRGGRYDDPSTPDVDETSGHFLFGDSVATPEWKSGNIPGRSSNFYSFNGTLLFDYNPLLVKVAGIGGWERTRVNGLSPKINIPNVIPIQNIFNLDRLPQVDESNLLLNAKGTYFLTSNTFSELTLSYLDQRSKQYDPIFGDEILSYGDSLKAAKYGWRFNNYAELPSPYEFYGFPFNRPGTPISGFAKSQNNYFSFSGNITSQYQEHEFKGGISYEYWTVRNYSGITATELAALLSSMRSQPDDARDEVSLRRLIRKETFLNNYGFDEFGRKVDDGPDRPKHPVFFAMYLQDKIEYKDLIINAGLRWDYIDMDTWKVNNPNDPGFDRNEYLIHGDSLKEGRSFNYLQPRLGFSFPVTDRTVFHLQYGQFVQPPPLYMAYRGRAAAGLIYVGQYYIANPVAYDIEPTRTTQYEIGFTHQFADFASFDITGFYKDIKGQPQYDMFFVDRRVARVQDYPIYINSDFATTKGLEFRLTMRRTNRVQAQLNYTLSDARGTNSFPGSAAATLNVGEAKPTYVTPFVYDQTHRGTVNIDYRFGPNDGGPILEQLGANLLFSFNSGHRFTRCKGGGGQQGPESGAILNDIDARSRQPLEAINNSTTPMNFNFDLRIDKTITFSGLNFNLYCYVQNLFNTKNVINVYYRTGNAYDDGYLTNPDLSEKVIEGLGPRYVELYKVINLQNRTHQWAFNGVDLFSAPRQIRFGVRVEM